MHTPHRYVIADLITDATLGEVPLGGVSYTRQLIPSDLTGGFPIGSTRLGDIARTLNDRPCAIYAYRGDQIWWGGVTLQSPIKLAKRGEAARCNLTAITFDGWPDYRRIFTDLDYNDLDRGEVLARLWDRMQADSPTSGIRVDPGAPVVGGDPWTGGWVGAEAVKYSEAMATVAAVDPAVEWTVDVWADSDGIRHRQLRVGTPLLGNQQASPSWRPLLLVTPERVTGFDVVGDHTSRPTHAVARGAATSVGLGGEVQPIMSPTVADADAVAAGQPRVDGVVDLDTEDEDRLFRSAADLLRGRNRLPQLAVTIPDGHPFHPGQVGDVARSIVDGFTFPGGRLDRHNRLIGVTVEPAERGRPEKVAFTFHDPNGATT